ncbi:S-adenosyl-L-methionine dependent methyltransferase [Calocera viscosa TUFC12733]|uniref:S-adenosyl-L-methionine dependent methyltransferase n=1 Tax=Calocera viscosa (strain TUFC12733) TaxID=1330018 RepID=A0A167NEE6_CALVF|nr:S-adenosyl-L-methionine dependent methyltransferase [Calocera viscosa TUFC12733]
MVVSWCWITLGGKYGPQQQNFAELAEAYPPLKPHVFLRQGQPALDFRDPNVQRRLTEAILHRDFNLQLVLPNNRLCPAVPNRWDYVAWINEILINSYDVNPNSIHGIDIGTGASAIYALLGCRMHSTWSMIGTDVDDTSLHWARENVMLNGLQDRVEVMRVDSSHLVLQPLITYPEIQFDFVMCNPPFYSSAEEISDLAAMKEFDPAGVCTGSDNEMIIAGGEISFVGQIVRESAQFGTRCRWYSSLLGKLSSVKDIVKLIRSENINNYAIGEISQGRTKRWAVAWSFGDARLPDAVARPTSLALKSLVPPSNTFTHHLASEMPPSVALSIIFEVAMNVSDLELSTDTLSPPFTATARRNTWSRAARREHARRITTDVEQAANMPIALQTRISLQRDGDDSASGILHIEWAIGADRALYESFCGHFARKADERTKQLPNTLM